MYIEPLFDASEAVGPDLEPALAEQLGHFVRAARSAFSSNTERAVRSDLGIYADWCAKRDKRALPANAETIADFVDAMAEIRAPATVRRYVASIAIAHRSAGFGKTVSNPLVRLSVQRMHRLKGRRQSQVQGLTSPLRQRLLEAAGDRLIDVRNQALLAVAYDAMLRRAELTSLQVADLLEEISGRCDASCTPQQDRRRRVRRDRLPRARHRRPGAQVARSQRNFGRAAVPLG